MAEIFGYLQSTGKVAMENRTLEWQQQRSPMAQNLGGMIFGCKHTTIEECLANRLFGLPSLQFSSVKNIEPGLPLFLFNYSDRMLYGIYEAASQGQMCIDPHAWTQNGKKKTAFPAQVRIRIRTQCQPLMEKQFSEIIKKNYYSHQHFRFELDHEQVKGLITLYEKQVTDNQFNVNTELLQVVNELEEKANMLEEKQSRELTPNLDQHQQSNTVLNLTVLQGIDPLVEEILMTAPHVTFYEFNAEINQWSQMDVEGSLFVIKRNNQPRFQFIVMNRRNTDNLVEDLLKDFVYEVQNPYLLYRNAAQEVSCICFYNQQDCEAVGNLFGRILNAYTEVPPKLRASSTKRSKFEELEAVPPPNPPPSLTPTSPGYVQVITRDQVHDALMRLVQNKSFVDMVYKEILNSHNS